MGHYQIVEGLGGQIEAIKSRERRNTDIHLLTVNKQLWNDFEQWHYARYGNSPTSLERKKVVAHYREYLET